MPDAEFLEWVSPVFWFKTKSKPIKYIFLEFNCNKISSVTSPTLNPPNATLSLWRDEKISNKYKFSLLNLFITFLCVKDEAKIKVFLSPTSTRPIGLQNKIQK